MSYTCLLYHIVFRPKDSVPAITQEHEEDLYRYIWGFVKGKNCVLYRIGGMPDHIHMLVEISPTIAVADFVHTLKISAGNFMKAHKDWFPLFEGWGKSYAALTYCDRDKEMVRNYIKGQKEHHRHKNFLEELRAMLDESGIKYDEKYFPKK